MHASFVLVLAPLTIAGLRGQAQDGGSASQLDAIATHRKVLLGPDPSPVGHADRRAAMLALCRMSAPGAHDVLRELLAAYGDEEKAPFTTLDRLLEVLRQELSVDLVSKANEELAQRLLIYRGYAESLVRLFRAIDEAKETKEKGAPESGTSVGEKEAARVQADAQRRAEGEQLQQGVREFFKKLPVAVRRAELKALLERPGELSKATIRIAGATEDPPLALEIVPFLADPTLGAIAQEALASLTLRAVSFRDRAEFEAWWKENLHKDYAALALQAARKARTGARTMEDRYRVQEQRILSKLLERSTLVLELALERTPPRLDLCLEQIRDPELAPHRAALLESFYRALSGRHIDRKELQRVMSELLALRDHLEKSYLEARASDRQAYLSALTICATLADGPVRERVEKMLIELVAAGPATQRGINMSRIFELLTNFPNDRVRQRVLEVLERPQTSAHMASGLLCLQKLGLATDKSLASRTLAWLEQRVLDAALDNDVRELALKILGGIGINERSVLVSLRNLALQSDQTALTDGLRATALEWANLGSASQLQAGDAADIETLGKQQLEFLQACLMDRSSRIRHQSAKALEKFPGETSVFSNEFLDATALAIVAQVGSALRQERHPACVRQMRAVLRSQAQRADVWEAALTQLVMAARSWAQQDTTSGGNGARLFLEEQLPLVRADLVRLLEGEKGIQAVATLELVKSLLEVRLYKLAGILLGADVLAEVDLIGAQDGATAADKEKAQLRREMRKTRAELILQIAEAAGDYDKLAAEDRERIRDLLVSARNGVRALASERPLALVRLGRALSDKESYTVAVSILDLFLKNHAQDVPPVEQHRARLLLAKALMGSGKPKDAAALLEGHPDVSSQTVRADALHQCSNFAAAEQVWLALLENPALPKVGPTRERALVGQAEALLFQDKLDAVDSLLATFPEMTDQTAKDKLALVQTELEARRKAAKKKALEEAAKKRDAAKSGAGPNKG